MSTITDVKKRIQELAPAQFQEFCDTLISKKGYGQVHGYGMKAGTGNTTIGNPDTYFRKENGKYVFVAYTIQQTSIYSKLEEDINKCLDSSKTGLEITEIEEIICCHTSSNLSAGDDKRLHEYCEKYGISLTIWGIDEIANQVHNQYRSMTSDFLGLKINTQQIMTVEEFVNFSDANGMSAPLDTFFQHREDEKITIIEGLESNDMVIVTGKAGVGKTRLVLEVSRTFANERGYKLLCVKSNNLGLYEDLIAATENHGKYLFFIDDANELSELNLILNYITKRNYGYQVKIIVTVRDYTKGKIISNAQEFTRPLLVDIMRFSDEEIRSFLAENLEIRNEQYVNQIISIAEGNPRMAYMAGRVAIKEQNLSSIQNVTQLYNAYYEKFIDDALGEDRDLCFTAGVLSIVNAIVLDDLTVFMDLLDFYGISVNEFSDKILQLSRLEVVEIQLNQIAALSDQCLANYMLYYVFFEKKLVPLSNVLIIGYKHFRNGVLKSINTILNLFESEETKTYCKEEIKKAWSILEEDNDDSYDDFTLDFHVFRPEKSFMILQKKIESIKGETFNVFDIDFSKYSYDENKSILTYLSGYQYSNYFDYVISLLIDYASKTSETIVTSYQWLENNYGVGSSDYNYDYYTQRKVSESLYAAIIQGNDIVKNLGLQWAKYSLGFIYNPTKMGRGNTLISYRVQLNESEGLREYRDTCWRILMTVACDEIYRGNIILFLEDYSKNLSRDIDRYIVKNEMKYVENLLSTVKCESISFLKIVRRLLVNSEKINVSYDEKWKEIFTGRKWELYKLLENDFKLSENSYEKHEADREIRISEYSKNLKKSDICDMVKNVNSILADDGIKQESYYLNEGVELIIQQFNEHLLREFLDNFIQFGNHMSIRPHFVLNKLSQKNESLDLLEKLKKTDFLQKNEWLFSFFEALPDTDVNPLMLEKLVEFLSFDSDKDIYRSCRRNLRVLDKFLVIDADLYPKVSSIIFEKRGYSSFIVKTYFTLLFNDREYSSKEIIDLFKSDIDLLKKIYFYMIKEEVHEDHNGVFLLEFLSLDESWLKSYSEVFWDRVKNYNGSDDERIRVLWKSSEYMKYFDYIFYHHPKEELYNWRISYALESLLSKSSRDNKININQHEWLRHIIKENVSTNYLPIIFDAVCNLDNNTRKIAIKTLLNYKPDYETFSSIPLVPNHWSGGKSFIPAYQYQIDFLESLHEIVSGVEYLEHKLRIKSEIGRLEEMIKKEEFDLIYRDLFM